MTDTSEINAVCGDVFDDLLVNVNESIEKQNVVWEMEPASPLEYIDSPEYFGDKDRQKVWPWIKDIMQEVFSGDYYAPKYNLVIIAGGIGIGKSLLTAIATTYTIHRLQCLSNPFDYFNLLESEIAFMNMATRAKQAKSIIFNKIGAFIKNVPWFEKHGYMPDPRIESELRFPSPKTIKVTPGNSSENFPLGADLYGGVIDEAAHYETADRDPVEKIFEALDGRRDSRFKKDGIIFMISDPTTEETFMEQKFKEAKNQGGDNDKIYAIRMAKYEADPDFFDMPTFDFSFKRDIEHKSGRIESIDVDLKIPEYPPFQAMARKNPEMLLRTVVGVPSMNIGPYILMWDRITQNCNHSRKDPAPEIQGPESALEMFVRLPEWFKGDPSKYYYAHFDLALDRDGKGDKCGFALGHRGEDVERDSERLPTGVIDLAVRFKCGKGQEIDFGECRELIYKLSEERGFKFGKITLDNFQSADFIQQLNKKSFVCERHSSDTESYDTFKNMAYDGRLDYYNHPILFYELKRLEIKKGKVDHALGASNDIADCVARVCAMIVEGEKPVELKPRVRRGLLTKGVGSRGGFTGVARRR